MFTLLQDLKTAETALNNMTFISPQRHMVYITDVTGNYPAHRMEHLSCFYPGLLALGVELLESETTGKSTKGSTLAKKIEIPKAMKDRHLWAAHGIAEACWLMYADNPSGLGSEEILFDAPTVTDPLSGNATISQQYIKWWDAIDEWINNGKDHPSPPGVFGPKRKTVVTNGGKNHFENFDGMPAGNDKSSTADVPKNAQRDAFDPEPPVENYVEQRTHRRDYLVRDNRWLMRPEVGSLHMLFQI
jgi:hypothetical protein